MNLTSKMDTFIYYLLLLYAFASSISIAAANIAISLASLLAVVRYIRKPVILTLDKGLFRAIGVFLLAVLLSAVFADHPVDGIERLWTYVYRMFPLLLAIFFIKDKNQLTRIILVMGFSIVVAAGYAIWQGIHGNYRAAAFSSHPMILAGYLIQMIPFLLIVGLETKKLGTKTKACLLCAGVLSCIALVFNGTRGAWIAISCVFIIYGIFNFQKNKKVVIGMVAICLLTSITAVHVPILKDRMNTISDMNNQSNAERILLWRSSWHMFMDHPLVGIGAGNFTNVYKPNYISPEAKEPELGHAHSNFFHMLAETGIIGFCSFLYMFGYILYTMYRRYRSNEEDVLSLVVFISTFSILIQGLTEFNFGNSAVIRMYWFILGLAYVSYSAIIKDKR